MAYVQVNDIRMYFKVFNNGQEAETVDPSLPTMIVLHGGPGIVDHQIEINAWSKFSPPYQIIFPDQRGCGLTEDGDAAKWNLNQCGEDIYYFSKALNIEHPILVGNSWGAYVIMSYLSKYANYPKALIFCDAEAKFSLAAMENAYARIGHAKEGEIAVDYYKSSDKPDNFEKWVQACVPLFSRKAFSFVAPSRVNMPMRIKFTKEELLQLDFRQVLTSISCPVLWLAGDRNPTHPYEGAEIAMTYIPEKFRNLRIIQDTGAPVWNDQPEAFREAVNNFLKNINV